VKRHAPATARNREPIAAVLEAELPARGLVLEIASGSGGHCAFFAERFTALRWQPSDPEEAAQASIADWREGLPNVLPPLELDAAADLWPIAAADAILCVNMVHISPWEATLGLMAGAGRLLAPGAPFILYGPYRQRDVPTAELNEAFDVSLKARDPRWGLRHVEEVSAVGAAQGLALQRIVPMPANNLSLVFRR
jgi:SAM-dependent methyltransferase